MRGLSPAGRVATVMREIDSILLEAIRERRADPLAQLGEDALSVLVSATYEDGSPLEDRAVRDELLTLLMAGYETTTSGLTWSLERLLRSPEKLERLTAELKDGSETYLDAVVKETLRRRPVIPIAARRALVPVDLVGYTLPARSVIIVAIYLIHSDPELFSDPLEFRPERFLEGDEQSAWMPFGGGVRRCLGAKLAEYEMKVVLRTILQEATLSVVNSADEPVARRRFTFSPGHQGRVVVDSLEPAVPAIPAEEPRFAPQTGAQARSRT
jgi:cytochrome P450